jgi:hypothetical protein
LKENLGTPVAHCLQQQEQWQRSKTMKREIRGVASAILKEFLRKFGWLVVTVGCGVTGLCWVAWGATYNFYFNNTEQGANSTASPTLTVSGDGKATKSGGNTDTPPGLEKPAAATVIPAASDVDRSTANAASTGNMAQTGNPEGRSSVTAGIVEDHPLRDRNPWRLVAGASDVNTFQGFTTLGATVSLEYELTRSFGLGAFGVFNARGADGGAEIEWTPIRLSFGPWENMLEVGPLLGFSSLGVPPDYYSDRNWVTAHAGVKVGLNFGRNLGIIGTIRGNYGYVMADAGLAIRL